MKVALRFRSHISLVYKMACPSLLRRSRIAWLNDRESQLLGAFPLDDGVRLLLNDAVRLPHAEGVRLPLGVLLLVALLGRRCLRPLRLSPLLEQSCRDRRSPAPRSLASFSTASSADPSLSEPASSESSSVDASARAAT